ncbi:MAG: FAD-dependent oxidoreductase [Oscillospiraceae bacterium]|nr:FAD-dependent oxidoreductase [Oscillospiraceae bacterium]
MSSLWQNAALPAFQPLRKSADTEVLIIGGGMAGLLLAHRLQQENIPYMLVEKERIGGGVTAGTTAKITSQHGLLYHKLIKKYGIEQSKAVLQAHEQALAAFRRMAAGIDCDFEDKDAYIFSQKDEMAIEREVAAATLLGMPAEFTQKLPLPLPVAAAIKFPRQAQFDPLRFLAGIALGLKIYENTWVTALDVERGEATTAAGQRIRARFIVVVTHFPFLRFRGAYFLKMYQHRSYVLALRGTGDVGGMYREDRQKGLSFRGAGEYLLLGGGGHRTGARGGWEDLRAFAKTAWPNATESFAWAAQDCMTLDGLPYIGQYAKHTPRLLVATGFQKWGMTSAMAAAGILADKIKGVWNPCAELFEPSRPWFVPQLLSNGAHAVGGMLVPTVKRCPHVGCGLKWNKAEHSWDCPCHGSRFAGGDPAAYGALLDNPANRGLKSRSAKK